MIQRIAASVDPVVLFEAPGRMQGTLADLASVIPDRDACVLRELTKIHEEIVRGTLRELAAKEIEARGEATLVIAGAGEPDDAEAPLDLDAYIDARLAAGQSPRTIAEALAALTGEPRRSVYQRVLARTAK